AQTAVKTCMAVRGGERVLILGAERSALISRAIADATLAVGAVVEQRELEASDTSPFLEMPDALMALIDEFKPQVSFYTASGQRGELGFRQMVRPAVLGHGARHAHMINITPLLMTQGMRVDYRQIYAVTMWVYNLVKNAREIQVTNPKGTDLVAGFSPERRWVPCHGLYHEPGMWGNLPEGEVYTSP